MTKDGVVPPPGGPSRRPAGGHAAEQGRGVRPDAGTKRDDTGGSASADPFGELLGESLHARVAAIGVGGPPRGGLARVRRKAQTRRRRRAGLAGAAGVLVFALVVSFATGGQFGFMPALTRAAGLGAGSEPGAQGGELGATPYPSAANRGHPFPPDSAPDRTGPAIGPGAPLTTLPPAAAAARLPLCSVASLATTTTIDLVAGGVTYGHVDSLARTACVAVGPPVLAVANRAGNAAATVRIMKEDITAAPALSQVSTWGAALVLGPGQRYQFQFAWSPSQCSNGTGTLSPNSSAASMQADYSLGYAIAGITPTAAVPLTATCGVSVFVTDIYRSGAYPLPQVSPQPSPPTQPSSAPSSAAPAPPTSSSAAATPSASAPPSSAAAGAITNNSGGGPAGASSGTN